MTGTLASVLGLSSGCSPVDAIFGSVSNLSFLNPGVPVFSGPPAGAASTFLYTNPEETPAPVTENSIGQIFLGSNFDLVARSMDSVSITNTTQLPGGSTFSLSAVSNPWASNPMGTLGSLIPVSADLTSLLTDTPPLVQTGSVTQSGLENSFLLEPDVDPAPEPVPFAMVGSGLVFLSLISSSTRKRKVKKV